MKDLSLSEELVDPGECIPSGDAPTNASVFASPET